MSLTNPCGDLQSLADRAVALGPEHGRTKELMGWAVCEIERLRERFRIARNIIVDAQNFIHPTTVWRDTDLMQRNIDRFLADGRTSEPSVPWKCDWPGCTLKGWHGHAGLPPDYK